MMRSIRNWDTCPVTAWVTCSTSRQRSIKTSQSELQARLQKHVCDGPPCFSTRSSEVGHKSLTGIDQSSFGKPNQGVCQPQSIYKAICQLQGSLLNVIWVNNAPGGAEVSKSTLYYHQTLWNTGVQGQRNHNIWLTREFTSSQVSSQVHMWLSSFWLTITTSSLLQMLVNVVCVLGSAGNMPLSLL